MNLDRIDTTCEDSGARTLTSAHPGFAAGTRNPLTESQMPANLTRAPRGAASFVLSGLLDPGACPAELRDPVIVYAIRAVGSGRIKVGVTVRPWTRFPRNVTDCPFPIEPVMLTWANRVFERKLHRRLKAHRLHGEWFNDCDEVLDLLSVAHSDPERLDLDWKDVDQREALAIRRQRNEERLVEIRDWVARRVRAIERSYGIVHVPREGAR